MTLQLEQATVEQEIRRIGAELAAAFPSAMRHPMRTLDTRAMELASSDRELRAALFRFVDVVPACRSLDDLARHLTGFLDELSDSPGGRAPGGRVPVNAAMRVGHTKAGRAALGAAAAGGVRHLAHRFIVGETPSSALGVLRHLWSRGVASTIDLLGEATVTAEEADAYARRCGDALSALAGAVRGWPAQPVAGARWQRGAAARKPIREGLRADATAAPRCSVARTRGCGTTPAAAVARRSQARRPHPHRHGIARFARVGPRPGARTVIRSGVRRGPVGRSGAPGLPP